MYVLEQRSWACRLNLCEVMSKISLKEFKPTILFLAKFVGLYLVGNLLYGWYITSYEPAPDPVTHWVSEQTAIILSACGWPVVTADREKTTSLLYAGKGILSVYEGCNGLNTMILFAAFIIAFGPVNKTCLWFVPLGFLIIHTVNLLRIIFLFLVAQYLPQFMYFTHKYLFTIFLYAVIFTLWVWWVKKFAGQKKA